MRKSILIGAALVVAVAMLGSAGCRRVPLSETKSGRSRVVSTETTQVARGDAQRLEANIRMGVGELTIAAAEANSANVVDATFRYAPSDWKPDVEYSVEDSTGVFSVSQPELSAGPDFGGSENAWSLKVDPATLADLSLRLGVGESDIDLSRVRLSGLEVVTGVGQAKIDLTGKLEADLNSRIECGVGELDLKVPSSTPVRIIGGNDGLGELTAEGFRKDGSDLVNEAWLQDAAGPKLEITIVRGIGEVKITSVD